MTEAEALDEQKWEEEFQLLWNEMFGFQKYHWLPPYYYAKQIHLEFRRRLREMSEKKEPETEYDIYPHPNMMNKKEIEEIKEILETIVRCNIHKVLVPDSDISMLVDTLTAWIEEKFLSHISTLEEKVRELEKKLEEESVAHT